MPPACFSCGQREGTPPALLVVLHGKHVEISAHCNTVRKHIKAHGQNQGRELGWVGMLGCCVVRTWNDIAGRRPTTTKKGGGDVGSSKILWPSGSGVGLLSQ